jgi:hypothetical protein
MTIMFTEQHISVRTYLPMDIISIRVSKLMTRAAIAEATPDITVATTGVPVNGNT